jgi:hypothetical protein
VSLVEAFEARLSHLLGDRFVGLIRYGAMCFPPSPVSDFDAHVFVADPFTDADRDAVRRLVMDLPGVTDPGFMDVWYVTLDEARSSDPPQTQLRPGFRDDMWALHRAHWHAGRFVLVRGPDPREIVPVPTWDELDASLDAELASIRQNIDSDEPAYNVLNLCRVLYSYENRDVVTGKFQAAVWAIAALDVGHHALIRAAVEAYRTKSYAMDGGDVRGFFDDVSARIARARALR